MPFSEEAADDVYTVGLGLLGAAMNDTSTGHYLESNTSKIFLFSLQISKYNVVNKTLQLNFLKLK